MNSTARSRARCASSSCETNTNCAAWPRGQSRRTCDDAARVPHPLRRLLPRARRHQVRKCAAWAGGPQQRDREPDVDDAETWPISCGTCVDACRDESPKCTDWVMEGECGERAVHGAHVPGVVRHLRRGRQPQRSRCKDHNTTQCHLWHDRAECERNPQAVVKDCEDSCGACTTVCMIRTSSAAAGRPPATARRAPPSTTRSCLAAVPRHLQRLLEHRRELRRRRRARGAGFEVESVYVKRSTLRQATAHAGSPRRPPPGRCGPVARRRRRPPPPRRRLGRCVADAVARAAYGRSDRAPRRASARPLTPRPSWSR